MRTTYWTRHDRTQQGDSVSEEKLRSGNTGDDEGDKCGEENGYHMATIGLLTKTIS